FEYNTDIIRHTYTSPITPRSVIDYNLKTKKQQIRKQDKIPGFKSKNYVCERVMVKSHDGILVPLTLMYKKGFKQNAMNSFYLYGYGSYGYSLPMYFSSTKLSLLNRGMGFALAHIRGGQEMGRQWYEDGKFLKKKNTFLDFIACAEYLKKKKWAHPEKIVIGGGSAGGMLVGAAANMRPDLFKIVVAHVPFVDVINTMFDTSLPLTQTEFQEWGNPADKEYYHYMKGYSPYDNVVAQDYPHFYITAGLNDPRVTYWEPAKWAAKLRHLKTDSNLLLFRTKMEAGHAGSSGRYNYLKEIAEEYAFLFWVLGIRV
ncbi:MAG: prolyl oligopeptidase family serine peptidase, partial [Pseudobdellovibrionaceae bacterium]